MSNARRITRFALISTAALLAGATILSAGCACKGCQLAGGKGGASCAAQKKAWPSDSRDSLVPTFFGSSTTVTAKGL